MKALASCAVVFCALACDDGGPAPAQQATDVSSAPAKDMRVRDAGAVGDVAVPGDGSGSQDAFIPADSDAPPDAAPDSPDAAQVPDAAVDPPVLEAVFLGVAGMTLRYGSELVVTAPFYTNPDLLAVTLGEVVTDPAIVGSSS